MIDMYFVIRLIMLYKKVLAEGSEFNTAVASEIAKEDVPLVGIRLPFGQYFPCMTRSCCL